MGWDWVKRAARSAPLYWRRDGDRWLSHTCRASVEIDTHTPVCHLSYLRGRRVRALGRRAPAERARVGARGTRAAAPVAGNFADRGALPSAAAARSGRRRAGADVRRRLGVDAVGLPALSGLSAAAGRGRRIQRQVHVQPVRAARRLVRDAASATCARATATSSRPRRSGSSAACASRATPANCRREALTASAPGRARARARPPGGRASRLNAPGPKAASTSMPPAIDRFFRKWICCAMCCAARRGPERRGRRSRRAARTRRARAAAGRA